MKSSKGVRMLLGLLAAMLLTAGSRSVAASTPHVGLVTDICRFEGAIYSLSSAGLVKGLEKRETLLFRPEQRWIALEPCRWNESKALIIVGGEPGVSGVVSVYEQGSGVIHTETLAEDLLYDVAVSADRRSYAIAAADGRVFVGEGGSGSLALKRVRHLHTAAARSVALSPDGRFLASGGLDGLVLLSELDSDNSPLPLQDHSEKVECVAFSPNGEWVFSGARDGRVRVHAVNDGRLVRTYTDLGGVTPGGPWDRSNQVLVLSSQVDSDRMLAATSLGYVVALSMVTTESTLLQSLDGPVNALLGEGESYSVGGQRVHRFGFIADGR